MPLLFNFVVEYSIRSVQVNQDVLKINSTHQLLGYADDVNILGRSVHTVEENTGSLVAASKEFGLIKLSTWSCLEIRMQDKVTV